MYVYIRKEKVFDEIKIYITDAFFLNYYKYKLDEFQLPKEM